MNIRLPITGPRERTRFLLVLAGVFLSVFAIVALSGPGRIDIIDGQVRFEVAKSLVLHGDVVVRNPSIWFSVFPGRDGNSYSYYRFPHSLVGVPAILLSDLTGPDRDARRHFFFALTSAVAAAALACIYFWWFIRRRLTLHQALLWSLAGVFCTPSWFYGTSTFDDVFAALAVTGALAYALLNGPSASRAAAFLTGLLFGLAVNVKQPLGVFILPAIVAFDSKDAPRATRITTALWIGAGLAIGIAAYFGYDLYKFPPGTKALHAELLKKYMPVYPGHFWWGLAVLTISPGAGLLWYCSPFLFALEGLRPRFTQSRRLSIALLTSGLLFFCFIASISFSKGDPSWGPRYLTPLFAAFWLFAPDGATRFRRSEITVLLAMGLAVQILALTVDPERLQIERRLPSMFGATFPIIYFDARFAGLLNRPREIAEIWHLRHHAPERFSWSDPATAGPQIITMGELGTDAVHRFARFTTFRPWWISHWAMPASERPISVWHGLAFFGLVLMTGVGCLTVALRSPPLS